MWTNAMAFAFIVVTIAAVAEESWGAVIAVARLWQKQSPVYSALLLSATAAVGWVERPDHLVLDVLAVLLLNDVLDTRSVEHSPSSLF